MHTFAATIQKFAEQGEKTGWTFITVPAGVAQKIKPGNKKTFRVKGRIDQVPVAGLAVMPMGEGDFILSLKAALRKALGKCIGEPVTAVLEEDKTEFLPNQDLLDCLADEPEAQAFFCAFSPGTQRYFSNWIDEAKTDATKAKRIAQCISALSRKMDFGQMIREGKKERDMMR